MSLNCIRGVGAGDPHLALAGRFGFGDALQHIAAPLRVELGQHVVEQHHRQLADLSPHPVGFCQLERQYGQALLAARPVRVQVDPVEHEREVVTVGSNQGDGLFDLAQPVTVLAMAAQLTPSEREALQKAVSAHYLEERGLREGSHGEIVNARGRTVFEVGFARAIRKVLA